MCPNCGAPMIVFELDGVEVDHCPACGGTWLDAGELEQIAQLAGVKPGPIAEALRGVRDGEKGRRRCPRCRRKMRLIQVGNAPPVTLDRCPRGHGLWFDSGEIENIIPQFEEGLQGAVARFLGELFAFRRK